MSEGRDVFIVDGVRTPFVQAGTVFKDMHPVELGSIALKRLVEKTELDVDLVDEVIIGNVGNPSDSVNISRIIALRSSFPLKTSAYTVHRNCASALESITSGYTKIKSGAMDVVVAGGVESMSYMPLLFTREFQRIFSEFAFAKTLKKKLRALKGLRWKHLKPRIALMEGLTDPLEGLHMGETAELLACRFEISRKQQDEFTMSSYKKAIQSIKSGRLQEEIAPTLISPEMKEYVEKDQIREGQTLEKLEKLRPYFDRQNGTVTAGNSCPISDGAAMVLLMSREKAQALGYKPLVKIRSYAFKGLDPKYMGLGPAYSIPLALKLAGGLSINDIGLLEINEAFAAQVLACLKAFVSQKFTDGTLGLEKPVGEVDPARLNVNGGSLALGHPVGATGTRMVLTLVKEMEKTDTQFGLASLCIGGGQGGAIICEKAR